MELIKKDGLPIKEMLGRAASTAIGFKEAKYHSEKMTYGYGRFDQKYGIAQPHNHAEELVYIVDCKNATIRYGETEQTLCEPVKLTPGDTVWFKENEWHVFGYEDESKFGFIDLLFFYPSAKNIRPEDSDD
jgi:hypothetical protein